VSPITRLAIILGSAGCQPAFVGSLPTKSCSASCLRSPEKIVSAARRKSEPDWH
jgi:hypothetical protein